MASATSRMERIAIDDQTVRDAQAVPVSDGSSLVLRRSDGTEVALPENVQRMLLGALSSISAKGSVGIGHVPEELTSTVAADMLGVSRPTLMKWVREDVIESFKVGTHSRFRRDDVQALRESRARARREAFNKLRDLDAEDDKFLDN